MNVPRDLRLTLASTVLLIAACALPGDLAAPKQDSKASRQPIVTQRGEISESAGKEVLAQAAGEYSPTERVNLQKLTDAVRQSLTAPLLAGNQVTALVDGPATFAAIDDAIANARLHIHVETYIFAADELGKKFAQLLMRKRKEGVEVRIIYDAIGSIATPGDFFDEMRNAGVEVIEFRPLNPVKTWLWKLQNRDHRKSIVVDGRIAFTGGLNITSAYSSGSISTPGPELGLTDGWRDTDVKVTGPVVAQFQTLFLDAWQRLGGKLTERSVFFPELTPVGEALVSVVASNNGKQKEEKIYRTYMAAIRNCSKRVWITQAYFSPPAELRSALIQAVHRGVDVRIMVPGFTDSKLILYAAHSEYERLLRGGVRIVEREDALLHAKTALIDDTLVIVGSANLDYRSFLHNNELTAVVIGRDISQRMEAVYVADLKHGKELTLEEWDKRSTGDRIKESMSQLVKFWL